LSAIVAMHGFSGDHDLNGTSSMTAVADAPAGSAHHHPDAAMPAGEHGGHGDRAAGHDKTVCLTLLMASVTAGAALVAARRRHATVGVLALPAWSRTGHCPLLDSFAGVGPPSLSSLCLSRT
ncbi:MAG TPA: hypothetical protein VNC22_16820, partial [Sporichthya sp.]|nr:hypothetical protein [Sporichthya sp.]